MSIRKTVPIFFVIIGNLWIWKISSFNPFLGVITILSSLFFYLSLQSNKKIYFYSSILLFILLLVFQYKTSSKNSLTFLNDNEKLQQEVRLRGYPPFPVRIMGKTFYIPVANWLEQRKEAIIFYKIQENLSEIVDPNLYFFANHPRERIGVVEYEKFSYILLPFFMLGIFSFKKRDIKSLIFFLTPLFLLSIIGNSNPIGPFTLFPFITVSIANGLKPVFGKFKYLLIFIVIFLPFFIQTLAYATY